MASDGTDGTGVDIDIYADDDYKDFFADVKDDEGPPEEPFSPAKMRSGLVDGDSDDEEASCSSGNAGRSPASIPAPAEEFQIYVGNLTWWTTDAELVEAAAASGVRDVVEVKFLEDEANGQSKGFCCVSLGSESGAKLLMERLPRMALHGRNPVVSLATKQADSSPGSKGPGWPPAPPDSGAGPATWPPVPGPARGPPPFRRFVPPPPLMGTMALIPPPLPAPAIRPPAVRHPAVRPPGLLGLPGLPGLPSLPSLPSLSGVGPRPGLPPILLMVNHHPAQPLLHPPPPVLHRPPPGLQLPPPPGFHHPPPQGGARPTCQGGGPYRLQEDKEFEEVMAMNRKVASSAIARAVHDASSGQEWSAVETLVTAINLIKQSKLGDDDRCEILTSSLQHTLQSIRDRNLLFPRSSLCRSRSRSRSRSHSRNRSRNCNRSRSRSRSRADRRSSHSRERPQGVMAARRPRSISRDPEENLFRRGCSPPADTDREDREPHHHQQGRRGNRGTREVGIARNIEDGRKRRRDDHRHYLGRDR